MTTLPAKRGRGRPPKPKPEVQKKGPRPLPFAAERKLIEQELDRPSFDAAAPAATGAGTALIPANLAASVAHMPVHIPGLRFELTAEHAEIAQNNIKDFATHGVTGLAANSRRTILSDWLNWLAFCRASDRAVLPIAFADLRAFVDALIAAGRKRATVEHHIYTLRRAARFFGCPDPMGSEVAKAYWRDVCREQLTAASKQAEGLTAEDVANLVAWLDLSVRQEARDAALVLMAYDLMARRNELAEAKWEDLTLPSSGNGSYRVPRSKTDQEGSGVILALGRDTVEALLAWREHAHPELPYVFQPMKPRRYTRGERKGELIIRPLDAGEIPKIWNRLAMAAGFPASRRFSGHSARVGGAQDIAAGGGSLTLLMKLGRWKTSTQPARYGEAGLAEQAYQERQEILAKTQARKPGTESPRS